MTINKQIGWTVKENLLWDIAKQIEKLITRFSTTSNIAIQAANDALYYKDLAEAAAQEAINAPANIEFQVTATHIQWRYLDGVWQDLLALSVIDGREIELQTNATHIQWRYVGETWMDLIALSELIGPQGISAYDVAVNNGFIGTEAQWIESLHTSYEAQRTTKVVNPDIVLERDKSIYQLSISANTTISFNTSQMDVGKVWRFTLKLSMPALKTLTWPANIYWYGGSDFSRVGDYYYDFYSEDNGLHWTATKFFENTQYVNPLTNKIWYVDGSKADDTLSGLTWANAKKNVQAAIDAAIAGDIIFVKAGTYLPTTERTPGTATSKSFILKNGVHIYGGFQGTETSPAERVMTTTTENLNLPYGLYTLNIQIPTYETILSGDLDGNSVDGGQAPTYRGNRLTNLTGNSTNVVVSSVSSVTIINGVTITAGNGSNGAGISANANTIVVNSIIKNNSASSYGGGCYGGTYTNCNITNNSSSNGGGGGCYGGTYTNCNITNNSSSNGGGGGCYGGTYTNCNITNNSSSGYGGGCYQGTYTNCNITNNSSSSYGGGGCQSSTCTNCQITNNSSSNGGGGGCYGGTYTNCNITNNSSSNGGGCNQGIYTNCSIAKNIANSSGGVTGNSVLKNCVVWGNRTGLNLHNIDLGTGSANYCAFENEVVAGTANISLTTDNAVSGGPYFVNPSLAAGITGAATDYDITTDSALKNTGNSAYLTTGEGATYDIKKRTRKVGTIDIGAYEFQGA